MRHQMNYLCGISLLIQKKNHSGFVEWLDNEKWGLLCLIRFIVALQPSQCIVLLFWCFFLFCTSKHIPWLLLSLKWAFGMLAVEHHLILKKITIKVERRYIWKSFLTTSKIIVAAKEKLPVKFTSQNWQKIKHLKIYYNCCNCHLFVKRMKINAIGKNVNSSSNIFVSYRLDGSHEWLSIMI